MSSNGAMIDATV